MRVAINGFGRIGRLVFRIMENDSSIEIVAINNISDTETTAYLLKYDSIHGTYNKNVSYEYYEDYYIEIKGLSTWVNINDIDGEIISIFD